MPTFKMNNALNGIELYFDEKPGDEILQELRDAGWRWHQGKKCWYCKQSDKSKALAEKLCADKPKRRTRISTSELFNAALAENTKNYPAVEERPITVSFDIVSGNIRLSQVQITKTGGQYSVSSTNNQIVCCDCRKLFSIHAVACPFCGCPLSYVTETTFNERLHFAQQERIRKEEERKRIERLAQEAAERVRRAAEEARLLEQKRLREERERKEAEKRRQLEEIARKRLNDIKDLCKDHSVPFSTIMKLDKSGISIDDLKKRIVRIVAYQTAYPSLNIRVATFITGDKVGEFVSSFGGPQGQILAKCSGDCANCTRSECVEEHFKARSR